MWSLIRTIFILSLGLSLSLVAIIGLTYHDTNRLTYLFTNPDGSPCETPCLFGIEPNAIAWKDLDKALSQTLIVREANRRTADDMSVSYFNSKTGIEILAYRYNSEDPNYILQIGFNSDWPSLGESALSARNLKFLFVTPLYINPGYFFDISLKCDANFQYTLGSGLGISNNFTPNNRVRYIALHTCWEPSGRHWNGFTIPTDYIYSNTR